MNVSPSSAANSVALAVNTLIGLVLWSCIDKMNWIGGCPNVIGRTQRPLWGCFKLPSWLDMKLFEGRF